MAPRETATRATSQGRPIVDTSAATATPTGATRVAAVMLGLGPEYAARVFRFFDEPTVLKIAAGAKALRESDVSVEDALREFVAAMEKVGGDREAGEEILRSIATQSLGEARARAAFGPEPRPATALPGRTPLDRHDPEAVAALLAREPPQAVAVVLATLSREQAQAVLRALPEGVRGAALARLSAMESVAGEIVDVATRALAHEIDSSAASATVSVDGPGRVAELLRHSPARDRASAMKIIEREDPAAAGKVRTFFEGSNS